MFCDLAEPCLPRSLSALQPAQSTSANIVERGGKKEEVYDEL